MLLSSALGMAGLVYRQSHRKPIVYAYATILAIISIFVGDATSLEFEVWLVVAFGAGMILLAISNYIISRYTKKGIFKLDCLDILFTNMLVPAVEILVFLIMAYVSIEYLGRK